VPDVCTTGSVEVFGWTDGGVVEQHRGLGTSDRAWFAKLFQGLKKFAAEYLAAYRRWHMVSNAHVGPVGSLQDEAYGR